MGERMFIGVIKDNKWKVAQYCNFFAKDPFGECETVYGYAKNNLDEIKNGLRFCSLVSEDEISQEMKMENPLYQSWTGAEILNIVMDTEEEIVLADGSEIFTNTFECLFSCIIHLDINKFLFYADGNLNLIGEYDLDNMPSWKDVEKQYKKFIKSDKYIKSYLDYSDPKNIPSIESILNYEKEVEEKAKQLQAERGYPFP